MSAQDAKREAEAPPLMMAEGHKIEDAFQVALNDPTVQAHREAASDARLARDRARTHRSRERHLQAALSHIEAAVIATTQDPEVARIFGTDNVRSVFRACVFPEEGFPELRLLETPSIAGRAVWTLLNESDVAALRKELKPGQVWGRLDLVDHTQRSILNAIGSYQRQRLGYHHKDSGRPKGTNPRRQAVIDAIQDGMPDRDVWRLAVEARLRSDPLYGTPKRYDSSLKYIRRLWGDSGRQRRAPV